MNTRPEKSFTPIERLRFLAKELKRGYQVATGRTNIRYLADKQTQEVSDIKHCVRTFTMKKHKATPVQIAYAEEILFKKKRTHDMYYHSLFVATEVLPLSRPAFTRRMKNLIMNESKEEEKS
jgi:hypothetical protein